MILSKRMQMVADLLPEGLRVADIGCDHGFVSIYLIQEEKAKKVIAMDINEGPLLRAKEHIWENGLENQIETRLSDGFEKIEDGEIDLAVIAGMGGRLVLKMIEEKLSMIQTMRALVLQPQSDLALVRHRLNEWGFVFEEENMVLEEGKYYPAFRVSYSGENKKSLLEEEASFGPLLLKEKNPVLLSYLEKEKEKFLEISMRMKELGSTDDSVSLQMKQINQALCYFK